jgi:hypothetical protein
MSRWVRQWAMLAGVACGGVATAQSTRTPAMLAAGLAPAPNLAPATKSGKAQVETPGTQTRAQAPAESIVVMRTAGQPERRLRVMKVSNFSDGDSLAEVQDADTGQTFSIPGRVLSALKKSQPTQTTQQPQPSMANATPRSAPELEPEPRAVPERANTVPVAQPLPSNQPYSVASPQPKVEFTPPPPDAPALAPAVPVSLPEPIVGRAPAVVKLTPAPAQAPVPAQVVFKPAPVVAPAPAVTVAPASTAPILAPVRTNATPWRATTEPTPAPVQQVLPVAAVQPASTQYFEHRSDSRDVWSAVNVKPAVDLKPVPTSVNKLPPVPPPIRTLKSAATSDSLPVLSGDTSSSLFPEPPIYRGQAPDPQVGLVVPWPAPPGPRIRSIGTQVIWKARGYAEANAPQSASYRAQLPDSTLGYVHMRTEAQTPQAPPVRLFAEPILPVGYNQQYRRSVEQQVLEETRQHVYYLYSSVRPSIRQDAASALAEGRHASRAEIKQVLANAAANDPAPIVRAHCIRLLSSLGYHETGYVKHLRNCENNGHVVERVSAALALERLQPKRDPEFRTRER